MEVAQRYSIAYKGFRPGPHDFVFRVGGAFFRDFGSTEIKDGDCTVEVRLERAETQLALDVRIRGGVVVECDRCLEDCTVPVDFSGRLLVKFSDEPGEYDGEVMWLLPAEDELDLSQYIYESIVLSLPYQRVHAEGGCNPDMLERFRVLTDEEFGRIEARAAGAAGADARSGAWDKLSELRERMERDEPAEEK